MDYNDRFTIGTKNISNSDSVYFIADIAANHDGSLSRAKDLIYMAKESGSHCAKFQHYKADKIVSDIGFESLPGENTSHQAKWQKSVAEVYDEVHLKREWNEELIETCKDADIEFMTTPYDIEAIEELIPYVNAVKIGSGDITFKKLLNSISELGKPILNIAIGNL